MGSESDGRTPVKLFFRIGEIAKIAEVDPSVIRYWEQEFRGLRPRRTKSGQRVYTQNDLNKVLEIKRLLYEKQFTTQGAVKQLRARGVEPPSPSDPMVTRNLALRQTLLEIRKELSELLEILDKEVPP